LQNTAYKPAFHDKIIKKSILIKFAPKNLQNKKFWIQLKYKCFRECDSEQIFILLLFTHMKMKKMLLGAFLGIFTLAGVAFLPNYANAQSGTYGEFDNWWWGNQDNTYNPDVAGKNTLQGDSLIKTIQTAINRVLWMLSLVALCLCLWGGFQMMTSGGDSKKYQSGLDILKWAAIGLAVIALAWLIVSLIFYVINGSIKVNNAS